MRRDAVVAALCGAVAATLMVWFAAGVALFQGDSVAPGTSRSLSTSELREWRPGDWPPAGWRPGDERPR